MELGIIEELIIMRVFKILVDVPRTFVVIHIIRVNISGVLIIVSSIINAFSRKKLGAASDWSSGNEAANYLSYSRHAGFVVPWKTHITCSIRTETHIGYHHATGLHFLLIQIIQLYDLKKNDFYKFILIYFIFLNN